MRLISELEYRKLDIGERNMCKALDDLERIRFEEGEAKGFARGEAQGFAKGRENAIFELRRKGNLSLEVAAEELNLSVEEYVRREEKFFS